MLTPCALCKPGQGFNLGGIKYCDYKRLPEDVERDLGASFAELDEVISGADIVTVHVPLSDKTCATLMRTVTQLALLNELTMPCILQTLSATGLLF